MIFGTLYIFSNRKHKSKRNQVTGGVDNATWEVGTHYTIRYVHMFSCCNCVAEIAHVTRNLMYDQWFA